jgi:hypothetical protein
MIQPFTRHFSGLGVPVLLSVLRDTRRVTLRTFRAVAKAHALEKGTRSAKASAITNRLLRHAKPKTDWTYRSKLIDGGVLDPRLSGQTFKPLGGVCLDLDAAMGDAEWSDYGNWVFPLDHQGAPGTPFNRYIETTNTKARTPRLLQLKKVNCALQVYVPFGSCDFSNCSFSIALHPDYGMVGNLDPGTKITFAEVLKGASRAFPKLAISGSAEVTADGSVLLTLSLKTSSGTLIKDASPQVYLEQTAGYLPKCRVVPQDGKAQFKVTALGLDVGDSIRVKAGFRHYGGLAEHTMQVI